MMSSGAAEAKDILSIAEPTATTGRMDDEDKQSLAVEKS
jgi:hypothetical protein